MSSQQTLHFNISKPWKYIRAVLIPAIILLCSCSNATTPEGSAKPGLYVLNEGLFGTTETSELEIISSDTSIERKVYFNMTGESLGDTPNDMALSGNRLYIVVHNSHIMFVLDLEKGEKVAEISFGEKAPREIAFINEDIAYVSAYDSTLLEIDLQTNTVVKEITIGYKPEAVISIYGFPFVACSGWGSDNRIFLINPNSSTVESIMYAAPNVVSLATDGMRLYAGSIPVWGSETSGPNLYSYSLQTLEKQDSLFVNGGVSHMQVVGSDLYFLSNSLQKINKDDFSANILTIAVESAYVIYGFFIEDNGNIWTAEYPILSFVSPGRVVKRDMSGISHRQFNSGIAPRVMLRVGE